MAWTLRQVVMLSRKLRSSALALSVAVAALAACSTTPTSSGPSASPTASEAPAPALPARNLPADIAPVVMDLDRQLAAAWAAKGLTPAAPADDATFLRRASLDLIGDLPEAEAARAFAASEAEDKRNALLSELTTSAAWAKHWTNVLDDLWMIEQRNPVVDRIAFRRWLYAELQGGTPYDELVRNIVTAKGTNSTGGRPDIAGWEPGEGNNNPEGVNGAVNWVLQGARQPQDLAGLASRAFLGVQIQCAECHDHPTESWTQQDFRSFTSAFLRVKGERLDRGKQMGIRRIAVEDSDKMNRRMRRRMRKTGYGEEAPKALDGTALDPTRAREHLAEWMTAKDNPWFAKAIVNRLWSELLGRGFVEPVDDFRKNQEVLAPEMLERLVRDFVDSGYDLRRLMRVITSTEAYARSAERTAGVTKAPELWERFELRPMSDTQLLDALVSAAGLEPVLEDVVGERLPRLKVRMRRQFRFAFDVDEAGADDGFTGTVPQALMLLNGPLTAAGSSALESSTVGEAARLEGGPSATIDALYLSALSRLPSPEERQHWLGYVTNASASNARRPRGGGPVGRVYRKKRLRDAAPEDEAYEDIMWALLNSSEFFFIH